MGGGFHRSGKWSNLGGAGMMILYLNYGNGYIVTEQTGRGQNNIKDPPLFFPGVPPPYKVHFARRQRKDISQCQRLVKKERNYYLFKSYTD